MSDRTRFGARWWRDSLSLARMPRAAGGVGLIGGAALALGGCAFDYPETQVEETTPVQRQSAAEVDTTINALELQKQQGWNVGVDQPLLFPGSTAEDVAQTPSWRQAMEPLANTLAPPEQFLPYYVPTLFQSLMGGAGQGLRAVMRPIVTPEMQDDFQRGLALRQQFAAVDWPRDTAIVVDAPGPRAVAIAAALADRFAPVFTFGNWPHPLGVVPAHQTLAATLYYLPAFQAAQQLRPANAPPLFVLDANRLAPYRDADAEFDNRYFVSLPSTESLRWLGIKHLLYVSANGQQELDDLNDQLLAMQTAGLDVRMVALGDFVRAGDEPAVAGEPSEAETAAADAEEAADVTVAGIVFAGWWFGAPCHWYYRGAWWQPGIFWNDYPLYPHFGGEGRGRGGRVVGPPTVHRIVAPATGTRWSPSARVTVFGPATRVVGAPGGVRAGVMHPHAPANFATVPVRASRVSGEITGVRSGRVGSFGGGGGFHVSGRSGSIGRAGGGVGG
jgi:hypothetical protein